MGRNEVVQPNDIAEIPLRWTPAPRSGPSRTIVIRHGSGWLPLALLGVLLLIMGAVLLGQRELGSLNRQREEQSRVIAGFERKVQELESGIAFDSRRRRLLLGMRDHIMSVNPRVSLGDAYRYAELAIEVSEKYPVVDPLLLLAIGTIESRYDPQATSSAGARGLYQVWPATGRLLLRSLGWDYDDSALYDPVKNSHAAALYLDILFSTYRDPQLVLAEYNGGPLNAGFFRAGVSQLAQETRDYVPRVLALHARLKDTLEKGALPRLEPMHTDRGREGKALGR